MYNALFYIFIIFLLNINFIFAVDGYIANNQNDVNTANDMINQENSDDVIKHTISDVLGLDKKESLDDLERSYDTMSDSKKINLVLYAINNLKTKTNSLERHVKNRSYGDEKSINKKCLKTMQALYSKLNTTQAANSNCQMFPQMSTVKPTINSSISNTNHKNSSAKKKKAYTVKNNVVHNNVTNSMKPNLSSSNKSKHLMPSASLKHIAHMKKKHSSNSVKTEENYYDPTRSFDSDFNEIQSIYDNVNGVLSTTPDKVSTKHVAKSTKKYVVENKKEEYYGPTTDYGYAPNVNNNDASPRGKDKNVTVQKNHFTIKRERDENIIKQAVKQSTGVKDSYFSSKCATCK